MIREMNAEHQAATGDAEIASRIHSYELAYRLQAAGPELLDFSKESPATLEAYGVNQEATKPFATNCLLARRMVERGVRFVMLMHASWDHHSGIIAGLKKNCGATDQPTAALLKDLKQRGMLDDTLVVWGGEFGRTPMSEIRRPDDPDSIGRDHHPERLQPVAGWRWNQRRPGDRRDGRSRAGNHQGPGPCSRPASHDSALPRT